MLVPALGLTLRTLLCLTARFYSTSCISKMSKTALVLVAQGSEEMEFVITVDVLRRAGVEVTVAGVPGCQPIKCSRDVVILPDESLEEAAKEGPYDAILLPGGLGGTKVFCESSEVGNVLREHEKLGKLVAAICAAPTALKTHKIGLGKNITSYPSFKDELSSSFKYSDDEVVIDENLITSRGPGTAFAFGLAVGKHLVGAEKMEQVKKGLLL